MIPSVVCANTVCITNLWTIERSMVWCEDEELPSEDYTFITRELQVRALIKSTNRNTLIRRDRKCDRKREENETSGVGQHQTTGKTRLNCKEQLVHNLVHIDAVGEVTDASPHTAL